MSFSTTTVKNVFYLWLCLWFKLFPSLSQNKWSIWKFTNGVLLNTVASWDLPKLNFELGLPSYWDNNVSRVERVLKSTKCSCPQQAGENTKSVAFIIFQSLSLWLLIIFNSFIFPSVFTDTKVKLVCVMGRMHQNQNDLILWPPDTSKEEIIFSLWFGQLFKDSDYAFFLGIS